MAMIKIVSPSGWDWDCPVASLVKVASGGLRGNDRQAFIKRASGAANIFLPYLDSVKFAADEEPVHLIALGASEAYGPNRNGDGFKEATCKAYHSTFTKFAKFYRNHKNKDPQISYGVVKLSAYNPVMRRVELLCALNKEKSAADRNGGFVADKELHKLASGKDLAVSMACALPGTMVKLKDGFKPVEEIVPGDEVLTHRGRYREVHATLKRTKRQYAKIHTRYCGRQVLEFTPDHLFYVGRWQDIPAPPQRNGVRSADPTGFSKDFRKRYRGQLHAHARWVSCGSLKPGDLLLMPIDRGSGDSPLDKRDARLLGYYMAEGSVTGDGYLCFTCNKADALVGEIASLSAGASYGCCQHSASEHAVNLTVYDKDRASWVAGRVGRGVRNKTIPRYVWDATSEMKLEFTAAWFNGDGWQDAKGLHWSTCSRSLSIELQMLLASVGIPASVYRIDHTSDLPHGQPRNGDGIEYTVNVSNRYSPSFAGRCRAKSVAMQTEKTTVFITGDYLAVPVARVEMVEDEVTVHDISVCSDESFTAFGVAVHNCRVPYDVCSWCGNKARTRDEYCKAASCQAGGCAENLTKLVKAGSDVHMLHVDNEAPTWFDISDVYRPADRIAYGGRASYLDKAASDGGFFGVDGAKLAQDMAVMAPLAVIMYQESMLPGEWTPYLAEQIKLAHGLDALEQRQDMQLHYEVKRAFAQEMQPEVDLSALELDSDKPEKVAAGLAALADHKIILPLRDFARMTKRSALAEDAARHVHGALGRMIEDGSLERRLAGNCYATAVKVASLKQRRAAALLASSHSLHKEAVDGRCRLSALRAHAAPCSKTVFEKQASDSPLVEELARDYVLYKVAALHRIAQFDDSFLLTARYSVSQNQAD